MPQSPTEDLISLKLLQLNLHQALAYSLKVQHLFAGLRQKQQSDYIFGKGFIADSTTDVHEALSRVSFHLNNITKGRHIGLYMKLDELKQQITSLFDTAVSNELGCDNRDLAGSDDDEVSRLLRHAVDYTARLGNPDENMPDTELDDCTTAHDLLSYCYRLLFDAVNSRLLSLTSVFPAVPAAGKRIAMVPISYLGTDGSRSLTEAPAGQLVSGSASPSAAAELLAAGMDEVAGSCFYGSGEARSNQDEHTRGVILFSKDTVTLYHLSGRFRIVLAANIYEAVRGNYIYLLVAPGVHQQSSTFANAMVKKLLYWLDFAAFQSHKTLLAGITNMTRNETETHLNMVGKMISFVTTPDIWPADAAEVRQDIDVFLEQIV